MSDVKNDIQDFDYEIKSSVNVATGNIKDPDRDLEMEYKNKEMNEEKTLQERKLLVNYCKDKVGLFQYLYFLVLVIIVALLLSCEYEISFFNLSRKICPL
jgi:hypothetical protein